MGSLEKGIKAGLSPTAIERKDFFKGELSTVAGELPEVAGGGPAAGQRVDYVWWGALGTHVVCPLQRDAPLLQSTISVFESSMAVTIQSIILTPPRTATTPFPCLKTSHLLSRSLRINPSRSFATPIRSCKPSDETHGSGLANGLNWTKPLLNFAADNFLPLALIGGVAFGLANPTLGCLADKYYLSKFSTFGIFFVSGLTLRSDAIGAAAKAWPVGVFGLDVDWFWPYSVLLEEEGHREQHMVIWKSNDAGVHVLKKYRLLSLQCSILLFTPYFSRLILQIHLQPQEFVTGLAIFNCMPTTLSSGVALTQLAGGNSALALAMTVMSNMIGILIIPFSISKFIADGVGVSVPTAQLLRSLVLTLLIPLILGKVLRESFRGLADYVDHNRKLYSRISAVFLSLVPWIQVSRSRSLLLMVKPTVFIVAIGIGALLHLVLLAFNTLAIRSLSAVTGGSESIFAKKENAQAALLVASQKTLPVMVAVVEQLGGAFGESGLLVLPCVAAHIIQIILDSFLVNFWLRMDLPSNTAKVA
ncbi:Sodium Bile acid symporter family isoform 1 [Theobroma cacao]|uniref:Probable sodium/metabolite cotransporter BASS4, chloroplastic n=1 Tax=Theobroma cacao TaxID=3641 RepID=A0A061FR58_THECC|nr:Sodium Bile acid symporter family isoform 1 [Theobroma cacao]